MKKCPFCNEEIEDSSKECNFCGESIGTVVGLNKFADKLPEYIGGLIGMGVGLYSKMALVIPLVLSLTCPT